MKILILSDTFPPYGGGGAETVAYRLAKEYSRRGQRVVAVTTVGQKKSAGIFFEQNFTIYRLFTNLPMRLRAYWGIINWQVVGKIKEIIKKEKPNIVHTHNVHSGLSYYSFKIIKKLGIPIVLTVHDAMPFCYQKFTCYLDPDNLADRPKVDYQKKSFNCLICQRFRYFPLRNLLIRYFLKGYVDLILAVSKSHYELLRVNKIPVDDYIYNGLPLEEFDQIKTQPHLLIQKFNLRDKKIVLLVGRQHSGKGGKLLIQALSQIVKKVPEVRLLILGKKGGYINFLLDYAKKIGVEDNVIIITGWLGQEDLSTYYQLSDLVVVPSIFFETFGLVSLEAMAFKKPVIGTCFGGVAEVVEDNVTGYIVNPFNTKILAEKIIDLLSNTEKAKNFGEKGYERLKEKFLIQDQAERSLTLMEKLVNPMPNERGT